MKTRSIYMSEQGAFNCGPSSHPDFIKNYFLLKRMFRFFRHSRQMPYFNVLGQKVTYLNERNRKEKEERERGKRKEERERGNRKRKEKERRERGKSEEEEE